MTENGAIIDSSTCGSLENSILLFCENKSENLRLENSNVDVCAPQFNGDRSSSDSVNSKLSGVEIALNTIDNDPVKPYIVYNNKTVSSTSENCVWSSNYANGTLSKENILQGSKRLKDDASETVNNILVAQKRPKHTNNYLINPNETSTKNNDMLKTIFDQNGTHYEQFNNMMDVKDKLKCCDTNQMSFRNTLLDVSPAASMLKFNKLSNISKWNSVFEGKDMDKTPSKKGLLKSDILSSSPNLLLSGLAFTSTPNKATNKEPPAIAILKQLRPSSIAPSEGSRNNSRVTFGHNDPKLDCSQNKHTDVKIYSSCLDLYHKDVLAEHANDNLKFEETFSQISEYLDDINSLCDEDEDKTLIDIDVTLQHVPTESVCSQLPESQLGVNSMVVVSQVCRTDLSSLARESESAGKQSNSTITSDVLELHADEEVLSKSIESANDKLLGIINDKYTASVNLKKKIVSPREIPEKNILSSHSTAFQEIVPQYGNEFMKNLLKEDSATIEKTVQWDNNLYNSVIQPNTNIVHNISGQRLGIKIGHVLGKAISVPTSFKNEQVADIKMPSIEENVKNNSFGVAINVPWLLDTERNLRSGQNPNASVVSVNVLDVSAPSINKSILYATDQDMVLDVSEILGEGEIVYQTTKDLSLVKAPPTISSRPKELEEFVSNDPKENEDNNNPEWEFLRRLITDEERYKAVRIRWRSLLIPNPKEDLTCRVWRRENNLPSLSKNKHIYSSESSLQSCTTPCTSLYDNNIDAAIQALEKRRLKLRNDHKIALEKLAEVQSWELEDLAGQYEYGTVPHYRWRQLHEHQLEAVRQLQQKYNNRVSQEERTAQSTIKTLQSACKEVFAFHSYYEGLDASNNVNALFLTDREVEELVETEEMLNQYQLIYNRPQ